MDVLLILFGGTSHFQLWRYLERSIEKQNFIHSLQILRKIAMKNLKYRLPEPTRKFQLKLFKFVKYT